MRFTLGPQILSNPYHRGIIRGRLTKALPKSVPEMYDEIVDAFPQYIPPTEGTASSINSGQSLISDIRLVRS
jgi:hypothetical protein